MRQSSRRKGMDASRKEAIRQDMKIIGVTGGIGSGKSEVLLFLKTKYKAYVCQLDEVAKNLQRRGTDCYRKIIEEFGEDVLRADGELERQKLSEKVFENADKLKVLNEIVHPEVKAWVCSDIERQKKKGQKFYVIEAALLIEAGYEDICDEIWYIYVPDKIRMERLKMSRGYTEEKTNKIFASQLSEETFRQNCTIVIDNSGTFENTEKQIGDRLL